MEQVHATCVCVDGVGVLIRGPAGSGKSDLALRLIDGGANLVADDRVDLAVSNGRLSATAPAPLAGLLEVRGIGVMQIDHQARKAVGLVVDLVDRNGVERLPESEFCDYMGVSIPLLRLWPFEPSATAKVRLAVARLKGAVSAVS